MIDDDFMTWAILFFFCFFLILVPGLILAEWGKDVVPLSVLDEVCVNLTNGEYPYYQEEFFWSTSFTCVNLINTSLSVNESVIFFRDVGVNQ